ncbi:MAG: yjbO [Bacillales bacterium]|jgi:23S rRNA pseudouridine1911/1915/1917 synthase|nr:yjbO [Bacillales bacterium]
MIMSVFELNWVADKEDEGKVLREFLKEKRISKSSLTDIKFHGGKIFVNKQEVTVRYSLSQFDSVSVVFPSEEISKSMLAENIPLNIVFEDESVLIVNKPPGMNTIPSREHPTGSLANALLNHYQNMGLQSTVHVVTRLDRDTSGLVLIAKHRYVHHLLSEDQKMGLVNRKYQALIHGILQGNGFIEAPIGRNSDSIIEREVREDGQYAYTEYSTISVFKCFSHVELKLKTGRTHQIRVHMSHIGHPLLGDSLYGGTEERIKRQALHCCFVSFTHPISNQVIEFCLDLPSDMKKVVEGNLN